MVQNRGIFRRPPRAHIYRSGNLPNIARRESKVPHHDRREPGRQRIKQHNEAGVGKIKRQTKTVLHQQFVKYVTERRRSLFHRRLARLMIDPLCRVAFLNILARTFLAGELPTHPDASPVFADVHDLAPILIQNGENEVMLSDAIRLAANLGEARVRTSLEVWPGMFHVWHLLAGTLPEADQALRNAVHFLDDALRIAEANGK